MSDTDRLAALLADAMRATTGIHWPTQWERNPEHFDWIAYQIVPHLAGVTRAPTPPDALDAGGKDILRKMLAVTYPEWPGGAGRVSQDPLGEPIWTKDPDGAWLVVYMGRAALQPKEPDRGDG